VKSIHLRATVIHLHATSFGFAKCVLFLRHWFRPI